MLLVILLIVGLSVVTFTGCISYKSEPGTTITAVSTTNSTVSTINYTRVTSASASDHLIKGVEMLKEAMGK